MIKIILVGITKATIIIITTATISVAATPADSVVNTENQAKVSATFFVWWKTDISNELSYKYWRDVHGPWASRTPGFYQYRQLHLDKVDPTLLSGLTGIEIDLPKKNQPNGIANIFYSSPLILKILRLPFAIEQAEADENYFVSRNTFQKSVLPLSRTYVDKINNPEQNGPVKKPRYVLAFKRNEGVSEEDFSDFMVRNFCLPWSKKEDVQRLRLELLEAYVEPPSSPDGTNHAWDKDKQYHAWIDLELSAGTKLSGLFDEASIAYNTHISGIHAYPVREIYTMVYDGKPTLVGLRGYPAAMIIDAVGARFQKSNQILKFTYGPVVNGAKLIAPSVYLILICVVTFLILTFMLIRQSRKK